MTPNGLCNSRCASYKSFTLILTMNHHSVLKLSGIMKGFKYPAAAKDVKRGSPGNGGVHFGNVLVIVITA